MRSPLRVGILHLYKLPDHFFPDVQHATWLAALRAEGFAAERCEFLIEPQALEAQQLIALREALAACAYDVLFVDRLWAPEVRAALPTPLVLALGHEDLVAQGLVDAAVARPSRASLVRVCHALAAGDALADVPDLLVPGGGGSNRTSARAQVTLGDDLRGIVPDYKHFRVLSAQQSNPDRAILVSNLGCAYRLVANDTGFLDGLALPQGVITAGCTFCNAEAYEKMDVGVAITLLTGQLRAVLAARPAVREIVVKDDYAVRFLDRLMPALDAAGLGDRDVLLSARPDYILTYREGIESVLRGRHAGRIGFYLLGFENFSDAELRRFNKGMTAQQMREAAELLGHWQRTFPQRFRLSESAGFILFTPWTTPDDLRENVRSMRQLGFERLRGGAVASMLRLYPGLPLYWRAKADGLLLEQKTDGPSDARRRGYEADHPWRFADATVAAVHARLARLGDHTSDGAQLLDALEAALNGQSVEARQPQTAHTVTLALNARCNLRCSFCQALRAEPDDIEARAFARLRDALRQQPRLLVLTGGELALEPWLVPLIAAAHAAGVPEILLETNAVLFAQSDLARQAVKAGLTGARVAWPALDAVTFERVTGVHGSQAQALAGLRALRDAGVRVSLSVPLLRQNRGALAAIAAEGAHLLGLPADVALLAQPVVRTRTPADVLTPRETVEELEAVWLQPDGSERLHVARGWELPPCLFGDPRAALGWLQRDGAVRRNDNTKYVRTAACAACAFSDVCPGLAQPWAVAAQRLLRPVLDAVVARQDPQADLGVCVRAGEPSPLPVLVDAQALPLEIRQFQAGLREVAKLEFRDLATAERVLQAVPDLNLTIVPENAGNQAKRAGVGALVWVARDPAAIATAQRLEAAFQQGGTGASDAIAGLGKLLGYPACCVEAHTRQGRQSDSAELTRLAQAAQALPLDRRQLPWPLAWGALGQRQYGHLPCTPDCQATQQLAERLWLHMAQTDPAGAQATRHLLQSVALFAHPDACVLLPGATLRDGVLHYGEVRSSAEWTSTDAPGQRERLALWQTAVVAPLRRGQALQMHGLEWRVCAAGDVVDTIALTRPLWLVDFTGNAAPK